MFLHMLVVDGYEGISRRHHFGNVEMRIIAFFLVGCTDTSIDSQHFRSVRVRMSRRAASNTPPMYGTLGTQKVIPFYFHPKKKGGGDLEFFTNARVLVFVVDMDFSNLEVPLWRFCQKCAGETWPLHVLATSQLG